MQEGQCTAWLGSQTLKGSEKKMTKGFIPKKNIKKWHRSRRKEPKKAKVQRELKTVEK